jgi:T5SS/PEP-CTERM-associated repeat protein
MKNTFRLLIFLSALVLANQAHAQFTGNNQTNIISGVLSNWTGDYYVGSNYVFDTLFIQNAGVLSNSYEAYIGYAAGANSNSVIVSGSGSVWLTFQSIAVGYGGVGNTLVLSNGGEAFPHNGALGQLGALPGASNNLAVITGSGSVWKNGFDLDVGAEGPANSLVISNGGTVLDLYGYIGLSESSMNNLVQVTGSGSLWLNDYTLSIGDYATGNRLVISDGGRVMDGYNTGVFGVTNGFGYIGYNVGANSNSAVVSGNGSIWSNGFALYIGYAGAGNSFVISNGGTVIDKQGCIGCITNGNSNSVVVTGAGSVWSNATDLYIGGDGTLGNSLTIANGAMVVASNVVNNGTIYLFNGGTTNFRGTFINNGSIVNVGPPTISNIHRAGGDMMIQVPSVPALTYQLQSSPELPSGWTDSSPPQTGTGGPLIFTDFGAATNALSRFYRVRVQ